MPSDLVRLHSIFVLHLLDLDLLLLVLLLARLSRVFEHISQVYLQRQELREKLSISLRNSPAAIHLHPVLVQKIVETDHSCAVPAVRRAPSLVLDTDVVPDHQLLQVVGLGLQFVDVLAEPVPQSLLCLVPSVEPYLPDRLFADSSVYCTVGKHV